jgi:hypothetical protein
MLAMIREFIMKVTIIGCTPTEIISLCKSTISSLAKGRHKVFVIVAPLESSDITTELKLLSEIGVVQTFLIEKFDYSAITQANADSVSVHIKDIKPSLVIMPSWKSSNHNRRILARVSLIACRGIGTVFMYEHDTNKTDFIASVIFEVSTEPSSTEHQDSIAKATTTAINMDVVQNGEDTKKTAFANNSILNNKYPETNRPKIVKEMFESHRTLLLEEGGIF